MTFQTHHVPSTFGVDEYFIGLALAPSAKNNSAAIAENKSTAIAENKSTAIAENNSAAIAENNSAQITKTEATQSVTTEFVSVMLVDLCTVALSEFLKTKEKLAEIPTSEVCSEAARLLTKNPRSFKLLSIVSHPSFFADWEVEEPRNQVALFGALAAYSLNKSMQETAFHRVAKAIRKDVLTSTQLCKPTKLRLRDCHQLIAQFMHEYALVNEANRSIVLNALTEGEVSGCGHLPLQQASALRKKLERGRKLA